MTFFFILLFSFFRVLPYFPPHRPYHVLLCHMPVSSALLCLIMPYAGIFFLFFVQFWPCNSSYLLRVVSAVQQQLTSSCFVRATGICSSKTSARMVFLRQLQPFLFFPIFLHHILQNTCRSFFFHGLACFFVVLLYPVR